nr:alpha/beta hydrolase-fold protein [uncultured Allomuricauda sp.]|tara:strand:+ start:252 stop:1124 length:873 start_codon:yes stop_codon:yes gene_type:complete
MRIYKFILVILLLSTFKLASASFPDIKTITSESYDTLNYRTGVYIHSSFQSKSRGNVDFNVYLPPTWSKENSSKYPLILLLHGQNGSEYSFTNDLPADSLNYWIKTDSIPEVVVIALKGGDDTNSMQWYSDANEKMITSDEDGELRKYCNENFNTSIENSQISIMGHSRGAAGALYFAVNFPTKFSSIVSLAFVSDYIIEDLKQSIDKNQEKIISSGIKIQMYIGNKDRFVLKGNRRGSWVISSYLMEKGIVNELITFEGKTHDICELFESPNNLDYFKFCTKMWKNNSD